MAKPIVLIVLDGWGVSPRAEGNAISQANKPNFTNYHKYYPNCLLQASGISVGLAWGEMGNSEVGHLTIGSGRVLYQNLPRISLAIQDGSFFENSVLQKAITHARNNNSTLHLMGLISTGGVHSHFEHLLALMDLAAKEKMEKVKIHAFTDGRDAGIKEGINFISRLNKKINQVGTGQIASLMGRFYSMDRSNNWDRTEKVYNCLVNGIGERTLPEDVEATMLKYYEQGLTDEYIPPTLVGDDPDNLIKGNDAVIFFNFREDRARQLAKAFVLPGFSKFSRENLVKNLLFVTMTQYEKALPVEIAYPPIDIQKTLGFILSRAGYRQLRIAETEKYAHVTYFFNGGLEAPFDGEDRILIPSMPVSNLAQTPEMQAPEITERAIEEINKNKYGFVLINYANADMVGHTGDFQATKKAVEILDSLVGNVVNNVLALDGVVLITGDHGNAEEMVNLQSGIVTTEHSINPVPLYMIGNQFRKERSVQDILKSESIPAGILADITPTIMELMGIPQPEEMTGISLLRTIVR